MSLDLVALVPDKDIEQAIRGLLSRHESLGIRPLPGCPILTHPGRDPGVYNTGHELLESYADDTAHALIVFDRAWEGAPMTNPRELAQQVEHRCRPLWGDRARCVCIEPEIEQWVWSDSPQVSTTLGWENNDTLRQWLGEQGLWPAGCDKPLDPKSAFERATREKRVVPSSSIFAELARKVSIKRCVDPSFRGLVRILQDWFAIQGTAG